MDISEIWERDIGSCCGPVASVQLAIFRGIFFVALLFMVGLLSAILRRRPPHSVAPESRIEKLRMPRPYSCGTCH